MAVTFIAPTLYYVGGGALAFGLGWLVYELNREDDNKYNQNELEKEEREHKEKSETKTNPFEGNVSTDIMVVDEKGNVIPVKVGEHVTGSRDGKWIQVRDEFDNPTGIRKDGPHSPQTHKDPRALEPHAHVTGINNNDGTPWLPINY
ncbi:hypothetical protein [Candidatus Protochlamydia phocaeensis]|uniref:hypothetical protein n=1 Tax=Candidatus Protochlamydia phocaeensis TaxID=1414722 RepID=UPI0008395766|nr:hypothetical protein [Candidatus Protochlamydia phocaeensis]